MFQWLSANETSYRVTRCLHASRVDVHDTACRLGWLKRKGKRRYGRCNFQSSPIQMGNYSTTRRDATRRDATRRTAILSQSRDRDGLCKRYALLQSIASAQIMHSPAVGRQYYSVYGVYCRPTGYSAGVSTFERSSILYAFVTTSRKEK